MIGLNPFTLSLSKGAVLRRSCFDKLSTNGLFSVSIYPHI
jgi:hypothetical protein